MSGRMLRTLVIVGCFTNVAAAREPRIAKRAAVVFDVGASGPFGRDGRYAGPPFAPAMRAVVPTHAKRDSQWVKWEGPAWESAFIGFRLYLDSRNKVDVFGKAAPAPALAAASGDYHRAQPWGADVLHVGDSLGAGSIAAIGADGPVTVADVAQRTVTIVENGPARAAFRVDYDGWRVGRGSYRARSEYSLAADSRCTEHRFTVSGDSPAPALATGLVRHPAAPELSQGQAAGYHYWYTWGEQSDQKAGLGLAVIARAGTARPGSADPNSHLLTLTPARGVVRYWICAGWSGEPQRMRTAPDFEAALRLEARRLPR